MLKNPYKPGIITTDVVGRSRQLDAARKELAYIREFPEFNGIVRVTTGPRGIGKTSLLRAVQNEAKDLGFLTVWVTAGNEPIFHQLIAQFRSLSEGWKDQVKTAFHALLAGSSVTLLGLELSASQGSETALPASPERELQDLLVKLCDQVTKEEKQAGLVLFIDEVQETDAKSLRTLCYAWQHMQAETPDKPILLYTTGLTHTPDVITDAVSFGERFHYQNLKNLSLSDAAQALLLAAEKQGTRWEDAALRRAAEISRGYPYFVQLIGYTTWEAANITHHSDILTSKNLTDGKASFVFQRDELFRSRWSKATEKEKELLIAMASLGEEPQKRGDIAAKLRVDTSAISMARRSLMDKGLVEQSEYGYLGFSVPGFAKWVLSESLNG